MSRLGPALKKATEHLLPHREGVREAWVLAIVQSGAASEEQARALCTRSLDSFFERLGHGDVEGLLAEEARSATEAARAGRSLHLPALAIRMLDRCCVPHLLSACPDRESLAECLIALGELEARRLEALLRAQEEESARRLVDAQEQAARAEERAKEVTRANEALRRSERQSQHRAEQLGLLASVAHRIAPVLDPERLMQEAAETIQQRLHYTYVAVVVLDDEGVLVGRWAGRPGVGRRSGGRAQGPPGGVIGRAIRQRAPQVVADVTRDSDYHADVTGTRSEMVIPLMEGGTVLGAIDYQSQDVGAFDLDDVAAGEVMAEFLVVALRNARLFQMAGRRANRGEE
jgi:putative methionine-R-sulfoxide reductase with GAF domain